MLSNTSKNVDVGQNGLGATCAKRETVRGSTASGCAPRFLPILAKNDCNEVL